LRNLKILWNELEMYRPHTIDVVVLWKRTEEDRIFQLLASLNPDFKDLWSHILMNLELPHLKFMRATIQHEDIRRMVRSRDTNSRETTTRVYHVKAMPRSENLNSGMSDYLSPPW
jgi:hypothetical protein